MNIQEEHIKIQFSKTKFKIKLTTHPKYNFYLIGFENDYKFYRKNGPTIESDVLSVWQCGSKDNEDEWTAYVHRIDGPGFIEKLFGKNLYKFYYKNKVLKEENYWNV